METMIPPQVGMILRTLQKIKEAKRSRNKKKERKKMREGALLLSSYHTCASKQHHDLHDRESHILSLSYTSGNFHYRTWLVYSDDGLPQMPEVFMSKQVGCTPTQFQFELSYTYSSSASVAWQSLLTHIDIYRWASPQPDDTPS